MKELHPALRILAVTLPAMLAADGARADVYAIKRYGSGGRPEVVRYDGGGRYAGSLRGLGETVEGLAVSPDGWLYASTNIVGGGLLARTRIGEPLFWQPVPLQSSADYEVPGGITAGPDGSIYATSTAFRQGESGVFRYDPADGTFSLAAPATERPGSTFDTLLAAVALSPAGDYYVARRSVGIERYSGGAFFGVLVPESDAFYLSDLEFGPDGMLYVPTPQGVDRYNPQTGARLDQFVANGPGGLNGASDLVFGGDGMLYVNSPAAHRIVRYDAATGAFRDVFVAPDAYALAETVVSPEFTATPMQIVYVVPEPGALATGWVALGALALRRRRRR